MQVVGESRRTMKGVGQQPWQCDLHQQVEHWEAYSACETDGPIAHPSLGFRAWVLGGEGCAKLLTCCCILHWKAKCCLPTRRLYARSRHWEPHLLR